MTARLRGGPDEGDGTPGHLRAARTSTLLIFGICGFLFAGWAARIPYASLCLGLSTGQTGVLLLIGAAGSLLSLPAAGRVSKAIGLTRALQFSGAITECGAGTMALGLLRQDLPVVSTGLFVVGVGLGLWDVAQNLAGAQIERLLGRSIMRRFHAAYSGGAFMGALLSAARVGLPAQLIGTAITLGAFMYIAPQLLPGTEPALPHGTHATSRAWRRPRNLVLGLIVLSAALTEGAGNDWIAKGTVDALGTSQACGALVFAAFVAVMTLGRWFGVALVDRFGRPWTLRASMALALLGLLVYSSSRDLGWAVAGSALWGAGGSLAFPVGISASADDPGDAAAAVSVVPTIGYIGFLAGPPALGLLGDQVGIRTALLAIVVPIAVAAALARSTLDSRQETGALDVALSSR